MDHIDTIRATTSIHIYTNDKKVLDAVRGMDCFVNIAANRGPLTPEGMTPHQLRKAAEVIEGKSSTIGGGTLDHTMRRIVHPDGFTSRTFTDAQFRCLIVLIDLYPIALSREDAHTMLEFPGTWHPLDRNLDVVVATIRNKLRKRNHIKTIHGIGYSL